MTKGRASSIAITSPSLIDLISYPIISNAIMQDKQYEKANEYFVTRHISDKINVNYISSDLVFTARKELLADITPMTELAS